MNSAFSIILLLSAIGGSQAFNDLNPCFSGLCSFDLSRINPGTQGSVTLSGDSNAISDITEVTGWTVLNCHPTEVVQKIRIVCTSPGKGCDHLDLDGGAEGKIIRLPQTCSKTPFVRVVKTWVHEDQSIPRVFVNQLDRREVVPVVRGLEFDADFDAIDHTKRGKVYIDFEAESKPKNLSGIATLSGAKREIEIQELHRRGFWDAWEYAKQKLTRVKNVVVMGVRFPFYGLGGAVEECAQFTAYNRPDYCDAIESTGSQAQDFSDNGIHREFSLPIDKKIPLINGDVECGPIKASGDININLEGDLLIRVSSKRPLDVAKRTLVPRDAEFTSVTTIVTGEIGATLDINANIAAEWDSDEQQLLSVAIPALDLGVFAIGPMLQLRARVVAKLNIDANAQFGVRYNMKNVQVTLPPKPGQSIFEVESIQKPLTLSAGGSVHSEGSIELHIIPRVAIGITMAANRVHSDVFVDVDLLARATLTVDMDAQVSNKELPAMSEEGQDDAEGLDDVYSNQGQSQSQERRDMLSSHSRFTAVHRRYNPQNALARLHSAASMEGCFNLTGDISINVGADAKLPGFDEWLGKKPVASTGEFNIMKPICKSMKVGFSPVGSNDRRAISGRTTVYKRAHRAAPSTAGTKAGGWTLNSLLAKSKISKKCAVHVESKLKDFFKDEMAALVPTVPRWTKLHK
ncbi:hypothetical protein HGRIS_005629 [Hohenbuehelia grisea]|uniref:Uncharacterized protein n=1 Tax=Hohenbuehelia grisea TaxID=104357 RepID=A0ABR3JZP9_9AGAR